MLETFSKLNSVTAHKRIQKLEISKKNLKTKKKCYLDHKGKTFDHFKNYIFTDQSTYSVKAVSVGDWYYRCKYDKIPSQAVVRKKQFGVEN